LVQLHGGRVIPKTGERKVGSQTEWASFRRFLEAGVGLRFRSKHKCRSTSHELVMVRNVGQPLHAGSESTDWQVIRIRRPKGGEGGVDPSALDGQRGRRRLKPRRSGDRRTRPAPFDLGPVGGDGEGGVTSEGVGRRRFNVAAGVGRRGSDKDCRSAPKKPPGALQDAQRTVLPPPPSSAASTRCSPEKASRPGGRS